VVAKAGENTVRWACKRLVRGVCERRWVFARPAGREKCEKSQFGAAVGRACRDAGIEVTDSGPFYKKTIGYGLPDFAEELNYGVDLSTI